MNILQETVLKKNLQSYACGVVFLSCLGLMMFMCGCAANKTSRVGVAAGKAAIDGTPGSAAGAIKGGTSTAISGGQVLQGARQGAASGVGTAAGSTAEAILRELLK